MIRIDVDLAAEAREMARHVILDAAMFDDPNRDLLLDLFVHGIPQQQGSKDVHHKDGRSWVSDNNKNLPAWRQAVTQAAARAHGRREPFAEALRLDAMFCFPRPLYHFGTGKNAGKLKASAPLAHSVAPDVDKLLRALLDSLKAAGVYRDDSLVCQLGNVLKLYADRPGARVQLRPFDPTRPFRDELTSVPQGQQGLGLDFPEEETT